MSKKEKKSPQSKESDLERRLREAGLDQEEIDEDALRSFLKGKDQESKQKSR